ncbi:site-specific integrase [Cupriavidus campinensis]|uniref:tyrosine-type recombinase/integrase n=1 Tax=Cupriavidus campinensis TaxID=151783 RepID=UPI0011EED377|nr:tyrosine-type recombinase/integrase [Cupriavidus campinensis]
MEALLDNTRGYGGAGVSAGTTMNWFRLLRYLMAWMAARDLWRFSQLSPDHLLDFLTSISARHDPDGIVATSSLKHWLSLFERMWHLRREYPASLRFDPAPLRLEVSLNIKSRDNLPWKPLEESEALRLIRDALEWIDHHGNVVKSIVDRMWQERRRHVGLSRLARHQKVRTLYMDLDKEAWVGPIRASLDMENSPIDSVVTRLMTLTEGACIIALLFLVGMRSSELVRLDADCLCYEGEPDDRLGYVYGFAAKKGGQRRRWVVAEPVAGVIRFLVELYKDIRHDAQQSALFLRKAQAAPIPLPDRTVHRMHASVLATKMAAFANAPYRRGPSQCGITLHPHMARKTFARFVVLRDKRALESLAYHYGHVYRSLTDGSYVGSDIALARLISEEDRKELAIALTDLLTSGHVGGKAARVLMRRFDPRSEAPRLRGKKAVQSVVKRLIAEGVQLAPCDWGYCVYSQSMSACGGDMRGPNEAGRSPDVCASCANFATTDRHRPYWNERLSREEAFLRNNALPAQTRAIVELRVDRSREILSQLVRGPSGRDIDAGDLTCQNSKRNLE